MRHRLPAVGVAVAVAAAAAVPAATAHARETAAPAARHAAGPTAQRAAADPPGVRDYTAMSTVSLGTGACSGSYVRFRGAPDTDRALVLTNGHCTSPEPRMHEVFVNRKLRRPVSGTILDASGRAAHRWTSDLIRYATETDTDVALYELPDTYATVTARAKVAPIVLAERGPAAGDRIAIVSAYRKKIFSCTVAALVPRLKEDEWIWKNALRYSPTGCETEGGVSGSPITDPRTGEVWAIHNTSYDGTGPACSLGNPCEMDEDGTAHPVPKKTKYGQQTVAFTTCLDERRRLDLTVAGCALPKPRP